MLRNISRSLPAAVLILAGLELGGCSSSEETAQVPIQPAQASATETMQKEMAMERSKNDSLLILVTRLEQENQNANARAVEAETQLGELRAKMAAAQMSQPKPKTAPAGGASYEQGLQFFHAHKYDEAAAQFEALISGGGSADIEDNCHYWLGECAFATRNYKEAIDHFNQVFTYKISEKKDDAQMMVANCYLAMGEKEKARAEYQRLIDKFPASTYIARAKEKLARL